MLCFLMKSVVTVQLYSRFLSPGNPFPLVLQLLKIERLLFQRAFISLSLVRCKMNRNEDIFFLVYFKVQETRSMAQEIKVLMRKVILNATRKVFLRAASFLPQNVVHRFFMSCFLLTATFQLSYWECSVIILQQQRNSSKRNTCVI